MPYGDYRDWMRESRSEESDPNRWWDSGNKHNDDDIRNESWHVEEDEVKLVPSDLLTKQIEKALKNESGYTIQFDNQNYTLMFLGEPLRLGLSEDVVQSVRDIISFEESLLKDFSIPEVEQQEDEDDLPYWAREPKGALQPKEYSDLDPNHKQLLVQAISDMSDSSPVFIKEGNNLGRLVKYDDEYNEVLLLTKVPIDAIIRANVEAIKQKKEVSEEDANIVHEGEQEILSDLKTDLEVLQQARFDLVSQIQDEIDSLEQDSTMIDELGQIDSGFMKGQYEINYFEINRFKMAIKTVIDTNKMDDRQKIKQLREVRDKIGRLGLEPIEIEKRKAIINKAIAKLKIKHDFKQQDKIELESEEKKYVATLRGRVEGKLRRQKAKQKLLRKEYKKASALEFIVGLSKNSNSSEHVTDNLIFAKQLADTAFGQRSSIAKKVTRQLKQVLDDSLLSQVSKLQTQHLEENPDFFYETLAANITLFKSQTEALQGEVSKVLKDANKHQYQDAHNFVVRTSKTISEIDTLLRECNDLRVYERIYQQKASEELLYKIRRLKTICDNGLKDVYTFQLNKSHGKLSRIQAFAANVSYVLTSFARWAKHTAQFIDYKLSKAVNSASFKTAKKNITLNFDDKRLGKQDDYLHEIAKNKPKNN